MIYTKLFALASLALTAFAVKDLKNYSFEDFVKEFGHKWEGEEYHQRKGLFLKELARVIAHNELNHSWKETINQHSALTTSERSALFGRNKAAAASHSPLHEKPLPPNFTMKPLSELPASVDWRTVPNTVTAVKDQGSCGSCWAFASTAVLESHVAIASGKLYNFSPQQIAFCTPNPNHCGGTGGCGGATSELAFDYVAGAGMVQEYQLGYQAYFGQAPTECQITKYNKPVASISGYVKLPENNYTALMNAIAQVGPVAISVGASTWGAYSSGVFAGCSKDTVINHAVVLVGYGSENGKDYWLVRNSWSPSWGENGYIKVLRSDDDDNNCGTDNMPQDGSACEGETEPVKVCGTCGILYDSSYPVGAALV